MQLLHWLKKLVAGQPDHADPGLTLKDDIELSSLTLEECDQAGIALGREIDALRDKRRAIRQRADALRYERYLRLTPTEKLTPEQRQQRATLPPLEQKEGV